MLRDEAARRIDALLDEELAAIEAGDHDAVVRICEARAPLLAAVATGTGRVQPATARSIATRSRRNELAAASRLAEIRIALAHLDRRGRSVGAYRAGAPGAAPALYDQEG